MLAPRTFDNHVESAIGELHQLQLLQRALACAPVVDHLGDQAVTRERSGHRLLRSKRADAPDRCTGLLLGVTDCRKLAGRDRVVLAVVAEGLSCPEPAQNVQSLVEQLAAPNLVGLLPERFVAAVGRAEADADDHPPVGEPIDGGDLPSELPWLAAGKRRQHRPQPNLLGAARGHGQRDPRVDTPHGFPDEQSIPTVKLGDRGQLTDVGSISPRHHETELHVAIIAPLNRPARPEAVVDSRNTPGVKAAIGNYSLRHGFPAA